jgi:hypothetical protein
MCGQFGNAARERVRRGMERYRGVRVEGSKRVREIMNGTQHVYLLNY